MRPGGREAPSGSELVGLSVLLAAAVVVPLLIGLALDAALGTGPGFLFGGLAVGIVAAGVTVYTRFKRYL
jgi:F0F1-type ATP synthase assembly protein I